MRSPDNSDDEDETLKAGYKVKLTIESPDKDDLSFEVKQTVDLEKVFEKWAAAFNLNRAGFKFSKDGQNIPKGVTPKVMGWEVGHKYKIVANLEQVGGK